MKRIAIWFLTLAEKCFLRAHGWRRLPAADAWVPPDNFEPRKHESYHRCHAVNAVRGTYSATTRKAVEQKAQADDLEAKLRASLRQ